MFGEHINPNSSETRDSLLRWPTSFHLGIYFQPSCWLFFRPLHASGIWERLTRSKDIDIPNDGCVWSRKDRPDMMAIICISLEVKCRFILSMQGVHALLGKMMNAKAWLIWSWSLLHHFGWSSFHELNHFDLFMSAYISSFFIACWSLGWLYVPGDVGCTFRYEEWFDCVRWSNLDPNLKLVWPCQIELFGAIRLGLTNGKFRRMALWEGGCED